MTAARTLTDADPWLDAHEAASYLRLSESRVRDLARAGELREDGRGSSGIRMWRRSTLDAWFARRRDDAEAKRHEADRAQGHPLERAIYAKLVQKVGNRHHWEDWAKDIAQIARTHIERIRGILDNPANTREREAFSSFADELRDDLNDSITNDEVIEMLAQHLVTKPVFEALFSGHSFATQNPISVAMQDILELLQEHRLERDADTLTRFYESVKLRAEGIESAEGKQKIIVEIYDKFFRNAFPKMSERLGIVYTPVEIVDFILHSVEHILQTEFGQTLGSKGVHILDPFTGTGTFITRLIQSGLISKADLPHKFKHEIHANEVVLLAYYIAAINIEAAYHGVVGGEYQPFEGICLTDTFQLYEKEDLISHRLENNSTRRKRQKKLDIRVIVGNPPYSVGQKSENDNNQNLAYPALDARIADTYVRKSKAKLSKGVYDSYVRAIRWASDRVGQSGIVAFVTNAGFLDANTADGLRKCLGREFSSIYIYHLRGNQRTAGEISKREGGKIFGSGSRAPVAISILVKNVGTAEAGRIFFRDIGDYLDRDEKLELLRRNRSIAGIADDGGWTVVEPDAHGDWLRQRDVGFESFAAMGHKESAAVGPAVFDLFSLGVATNRDAWAYSPSRKAVAAQMRRLVEVYERERNRFNETHGSADRHKRETLVGDFVTGDSAVIAWTANLKSDLARDRPSVFESEKVVAALYRPFSRQWLYFDRRLNERVFQMPRIFPVGSQNLAILVKQRWYGIGFPALMVNAIPDLQSDGGAQCFPLYVYETAAESLGDGSAAQSSLFDDGVPERNPGRRSALSDAGVTHFAAGIAESLSKEDLFYYVYGILHSPEYRERYADNLGKDLPRIPRVKTAADFWAFSKAGRELGELHVGYEKVPEHPATVEISVKKPEPETYRVESMRFGKGEKVDGKMTKDKTTVVYNDFITLKNIPLEAYEYVVNGKSAIEWVMERQGVSTDKASGIVKDANDYAIETMNDPRYPLSLLLRVITVSLETVRIVKALPALEVREDG